MKELIIILHLDRGAGYIGVFSLNCIFMNGALF